MSNLQRHMMKSHLPPLAPARAAKQERRHKDYNPTQWSFYFHDYVDVSVDEESTFRCYQSKPSDIPDPLLLVLLHGGGYSGLTWACFTVSFEF
jgi:protein phosphatase methylesterase 1